MFSVISHSTGEAGAAYEIALNADHTIYKAHFPGQPVTPGVCIIGIAKELLEDVVGASLEIAAIKSVKFVAVLSPSEYGHVNCEIRNVENEADIVKAQVTLFSEETVFAKLSFTCRK